MVLQLSAVCIKEGNWRATRDAILHGTNITPKPASGSAHSGRAATGAFVQGDTFHSNTGCLFLLLQFQVLRSSVVISVRLSISDSVHA